MGVGSQQVQGPSRTYRTILADDDPLFREWLRPVLENSAHFQVLGEACNGAECIRLVDKVRPDLVVLDVYMPDWDGLELADYLKKNFADIKTIVTSSHNDEVYSRLAEQDGAVAFIPKARLSVTALLDALR
ncbi:MAG: response regulator transcription factor [Dehalococcoidia bacterium]|nr:response regulator transcription factor [Dehalococcoidia bacterium]